MRKGSKTKSMLLRERKAAHRRKTGHQRAVETANAGRKYAMLPAAALRRVV